MPDERKSSKRESARLSPELILRTALQMTDTQGDVQSLTMRALASELGVGVMTLYTYFRNKEEIYDGMADLVLGEVVMEENPRDAEAAVRSFAQAIVTVLTEHPSVASLLGSRLTNSEQALHGSLEVPLRRLVDAGIPGPLAVRCYGFVMVFAIGLASYRVARPWGLAGDSEEAAELRRQRSHHYAGQSMKKFPTVVALANDIVDIASHRTYEFGIDALVAMVRHEMATDPGLQMHNDRVTPSE